MKKRAFNWRTYVSLYINCVIVLMVFLASVWMITDWIPYVGKGSSGMGTRAFRYYTVDSNILMGITSLILVVRNILKLLRVELRPSRFISFINLTAVTGVTMTALAVICLLAPVAEDGFTSLYLKGNFFFHFTVPVLAFLDYVFFADNARIRWQWCFAAMIPVIGYAVFYILPLYQNASTHGTFPPEYDWYHFFSGNVSNVPFRVFLLAAAFFALCFLTWDLAQKRNDGNEKRRHEDGQSFDLDSISDSLTSSVITSSEYYLTNVIRIICIVAPLTAIAASGVFTTLWLSGNYSFSVVGMFAFDSVCLAYLTISLLMYNTCIDEKGLIVSAKIPFAKATLTVLLLLQWNLISYLAPFRDLWAYSLLFVLLSALFLDSKLVLINIAALSASIVLSVIKNGGELLPLPGATFVAELVFRATLIVLGFIIIFLLVRLIEKTLLNTLDKLSDYDVLTHALNRRKLHYHLTKAIDKFNSSGEPFCVAIFDLDDFKAVNDTYGHTNGDEVLVEFVRVINSGVTSSDYVFRYGGEEFLVLYKCSGDIACESCKRILHRLKATVFPFMTEGECQTATAGLARYAEGMTADELIVLADERLYCGKQNGKDKVVFESRKA